MTPLQQLRHCRTVAALQAWRATQGDLDSMTTAAFLARLAALRNAEGGE